MYCHANNANGDDSEEFGRRKGAQNAETLDEGVDDAEQDEEDEEEGKLEEAEAEPGGMHDGFGIGDPEVDEDDDANAEGGRPKGEPAFGIQVGGWSEVCVLRLF